MGLVSASPGGDSCVMNRSVHQARFCPGLYTALCESVCSGVGKLTCQAVGTSSSDFDTPRAGTGCNFS